ncbi:hypothetical protein [Nocardia brevicatena]|nr:hypothetical protein [Nocardia brevicatena]
MLTDEDLVTELHTAGLTETARVLRRALRQRLPRRHVRIYES